ncbi:hypothetical protein Blut17040_14120 [Blautia luti]|uniref:Uncharacterized protein n=1 Tax=Blautia luti DSM 14534 = JCM 17040 TaxID=649762 RepID=A0A844GK95_9FIRM|nr:hypothetical protein [Blautia luti]MTD60687.1 hypothetical protein [Blautia luti DSM 14534 = JCM 17040]BEI60383.1 hypothetical protein Blut17040_14120 [Blautia luti]
MEKNTTNYKFLNAKDRATERKNSHSVLDTDRYHYMTAPHVQTSKRKRDRDGFFTPYEMFHPYSGTGLLCAIFGETPARKTSDLRGTQDMLAKEAYEHEIELFMCQAKSYELQFYKRFCAEDRAEECYAKAVAAGKHPDAPKLTAEDTRQTILDAVTWRFDWIQQNKRKCYRFAEILIDAKEHRLVTDREEEENFVDLFVRNAALMPEPNRKLIDCMYEAAWYSIYMFKYGLDRQKVPAPWYDTKEHDSGKGRVND